VKAIGKRLAEMRNNPQSTSFSDALKAAEHYFGKPRISGSHHIFKTPWAGDPRINLQAEGRDAKPYQVQQLLKAIDMLAASKAEEGSE
jgi:hypothetical protein